MPQYTRMYICHYMQIIFEIIDKYLMKNEVDLLFANKMIYFRFILDLCKNCESKL